jgi:hypothetical protein
MDYMQKSIYDNTHASTWLNMTNVTPNYNFPPSFVINYPYWIYTKFLQQFIRFLERALLAVRKLGFSID